MCCRRKGQRAPLAVTSSKLIYDKYQERQDRKAHRITAMDERFASTEHTNDFTSSKMLQEVDARPPSYDDVVAPRTMFPQQDAEISGKAIADMRKDSMHDDNALVYGDRAFATPRDRAAILPFAIGKHGDAARSRSYVDPNSCRSKCERKRAEKAARKAEKQALKLANDWRT
ncbi:hypothetical protein LTR37_020366 [Vermiconidia calcicola]|uniref:Uncharacterized protein n=1 Tax=Vermiconidia calcicola TaxID=1690605 RepID=A0ACC3MEL4_9PEZI|nr:hypothetical protein LTR37_020366 [Vermiconidia calcicola]